MPVMAGISETETVIKRILPYLRRRGYDETTDFEYETGTEFDDRYAKGYVDILVTAGKAQPQFLVEAKRLSRSLTQGDEKQALDYGRAHKVPFVVLTNGREMRCLNVHSRTAIRWDGSLVGVVPSRHQLAAVVEYLRRNKDATDVPLSATGGLPFRPGLPLRQLNNLFAKCHTTIRNIEKQEDHAFADFSKILFLKLLEEKADLDGSALPYSYRFHELATIPPAKADQVKSSIESMIAVAEKTYGDVLADPLRLNTPATFLKIVKALSEVSFNDSEADVKGAAFEYFVRATLKGKRLGQYFTPRPLVQLMVAMVGREKVVEALRSGTEISVCDPACGTGGFLVFMLRDAWAQIDALHAAGKLTAATRTKLMQHVMSDVFHGADANEGVASAAKMNMVIAGDGHANIKAEDTLRKTAQIWDRKIDLIITNPPFGTSEADSLTPDDVAGYPFQTTKGQLLFLQRMLAETEPEGLICTVIDEGVLNTDLAAPIRRMILEQTEIQAVVRLPSETFKPNKINVRSDVLLLKKRMQPDVDLVEDYAVRYIDVDSLGYDGSGIALRGFEFSGLVAEIEALVPAPAKTTSGTAWQSFPVSSKEIAADSSHRFDLKYWVPELRAKIAKLAATGAQTVENANTILTRRGSSPSTELYVDQKDGFARVLKAGSSIDAMGRITPVVSETDFIEKAEYDKIADFAKVQKWDVLLSSTGDGTLGKSAVYEGKEPAVADVHITIIRVDRKAIDPRYLADYLRAGFGRRQVNRLFTGSTGLIELSADQVDRIVLDLPSLEDQKKESKKLRAAEAKSERVRVKAAENVLQARSEFLASTA